MGHVRVQQTVKGALPHIANPPIVQFEQMPRFRLWEMGLAAPIPGVPGRGWFDLRWFTVRSLAARRLIKRRIGAGNVDVVHVTSNDIALFLGDVQRVVPCVISTDVLLEDWLR